MAKQTIRISGEISDYTAWRIDQFLADNKGKAVVVRLASSGGDVAAAVRMSHAFAEHGDVTLIHDSFNASAATWLFGAKTIKMYSDCMLYIHCSSKDMFFWQKMNAEQLKQFGLQTADVVKNLENIDTIIANKYASRGKKTADEMLAVMKAHPWLTADQCKDYGLVDEVIEEKAPQKVSNEMIASFRNCAIPLPEGDVLQDERSFFQRFGEFLGLKLGSANNTMLTSKESSIMNKKFLNVNALLKVEGLEENDGKVVLTTQQLQAVEDNLAELQGKVENNGNLEKTIADKLDAFSEEVKNTEGLQAKIQKIKDVFDHIPAAVPTQPTASDKQDGDVFADIRKDPVNNYLEE